MTYADGSTIVADDLIRNLEELATDAAPGKPFMGLRYHRQTIGVMTKVNEDHQSAQRPGSGRTSYCRVRVFNL